MTDNVDAELAVDVRRVDVDDVLDGDARVERVVELGELLEVEELDVRRPPVEDEVPAHMTCGEERTKCEMRGDDEV